MGARLARDGASTFNTPAIASKLCSHRGICAEHKFLAQRKSTGAMDNREIEH